MAALLPETMRAACVERLGPPEAIAVGELAVPIPGPTDVLVAVELAAANPVDTFVRSGRYPTRVPFPFVVGRDLVGTVTGRGSGAPFDVGERVWANSLGHDGRQGSFSAYAVVPADRCYRLPDGVDPALGLVRCLQHLSRCETIFETAVIATRAPRRSRRAERVAHHDQARPVVEGRLHADLLDQLHDPVEDVAGSKDAPPSFDGAGESEAVPGGFGDRIRDEGSGFGSVEQEPSGPSCPRQLGGGEHEESVSFSWRQSHRWARVVSTTSLPRLKHVSSMAGAASGWRRRERRFEGVDE